MGRLAGFKYREIVKRLKKFGFEFDQQAARGAPNPEIRRIPNPVYRMVVLVTNGPSPAYNIDV
jgi:hypothetical protein